MTDETPAAEWRDVRELRATMTDLIENVGWAAGHVAARLRDRLDSAPSPAAPPSGGVDQALARFRADPNRMRDLDQADNRSAAITIIRAALSAPVPPPSGDVDEALAWFRDNPDRVRSVEGRLRSGRYAARIVRAALAAGPDEFGTPGDGNGVRLAQEYMERHAAARPAGDATTEIWTEVRLRGQPPGSRPYDFTFRSDRDHWQHVDDFLNRITKTWTDFRVESRTVTTTRTETPWKAEQT